MSATLTISPTIARRLAITSQRLTGPRPARGQMGIMEVLRAIRCLQLDPISVVARSHQLVLWSRLGNYRREDLEALLWHDRLLFEYWAHEASIVLMEDYPLHAHRMVAHRAGGIWSERFNAWVQENEALRDHILAELRAHGPLSSSHFEDRSRTDWYSTGWTSGRTISQMLQSLWVQGEILVASRKGMTRLWDLAERIIPAEIAAARLADDATVRLAAQHALRALGVASPNQIRKHFTRRRYPNLERVLATLEAEGIVQQVGIAADGQRWPGTWYLHADNLPALERLVAGEWEPRTTLLSPFDNLICDRNRTQQFFGFDYTVEIYVPAAKRRYGYYVLPILHGDHFIGRLDPQFERKTQRLVIRAQHAEAHAPRTKAAARAIQRTLEDLAQFVGAKEITYADGVERAWAG